MPGTEKVMDELDTIRASKFIQMIFEPEERSIFSVGVEGSGFTRAECFVLLKKLQSVTHNLDCTFGKDGHITKY